ncbi:hypothetical protein BD779DRAFT_1509620 [Infundibulicybe gibba]|nr:hypothetical protein BD779DRAFT_1509620 [Infundibulicybe gibba]
MFRLVLPRSTAGSRSFVSSVLLTRSWESETVAVLKREARSRGLSQTGNKATLISKIQEHDNSTTLKAIDPVRAMSTAPEPTGLEGVAPGIPPATHPTPPPAQLFLNVKIPDLSQPEPESPIQIPFVPDFWDSQSAAPVDTEPEEPALPKLLVVAGADTHHGGGPSHNLHDEHATTIDPLPVEESAPKKLGQGGFWDDVTEDIGLPPPREIKNAFWKLFS